MAKNVKQSKQKKSVLNKLGGLSKRSKFIVVVLIFAVLGGGYLTYKSFAATAGPAPIQNYAGSLTFIGLTTGCTSNKANDPGKNNLLVMNVYCPPRKLWTVRTTRTASTNVTWPKGTQVICVMAKGVGKIRVSDVDRVKFTGNGAAYYNINSPDYKEYCSTPITIREFGTVMSLNSDSMEVGSHGQLERDNNNDSATLISISYLIKRWYAPGVAPAPSGGK